MTLGLVTTALVGCASGTSSSVSDVPRGAAPPSDCLADRPISVVSGVRPEQFELSRPPAGMTVDARGAVFTGYPDRTLYPLTVGKGSPARGFCLIGGLVVGQQSRRLTWQEMKTRHDGAGARVAGNDGYVVDGLRVDNVEDGIDPRGTDGRYPKDGDGFLMRNLYFTYIRDDCVENDDIAGGIIEDSLFDGCNTGISERPSKGDRQLDYPAPAGEELVMRHVLLRLRPMPGPRGKSANVLGHGQLFKWSGVANRLRIEDSVFLVEETPNDGRANFPPGTIAKNVTVVWLGPGAFPGRVPAGVRITRDRKVWTTARDRWMARHSCTSITACDRLINPTGSP